MRIIQELLTDDHYNQYKISFVVNLGSARELIGKSEFDIILLDLSLPDSSGIDTLKQILLFFAETPIIVLTGLQDEILAQKSIQTGAQDYIIKNNMTTEILAHSVRYAIDRQKFLKKIAENHLQYQTLIEKNSDGIIVVDKEGVIKYVNPAAEILLGQSQSDLLDQSFGFPLSVNGGTEISLIDKGAVIKIVEMRVSKVIWNDVPSFMASLRDVSERKALEEKKLEYQEKLEEASQAKDKFFSIIAHDLRSPLSSFLGLTELMSDDLAFMSHETLQQMVDSMKGSATNLYRLMENLLQWAKLQRGGIPFDPEVILLLPIVNEVLAMVQESAQKKNIYINFDIPDDLEVVADSNMIQSVLRNLLSNALKFTSIGGKIFLSAKVFDSKNMEISVRDNGIGMSCALLDNLFKIDSKSNRKGTEGEPSTGLGLILSKEFIEKNGGKIKVESEVGQGSKFSFTVPRNVKPENLADQTESEPAIPELIKTGGLNVLIADDDEASGRLISFIVKNFAGKIIRVKNGLEEVQAFKDTPDIDLIITDIRMPEMDGYEAVRQIRKINRKVIIIALTDFAQSGEKEIAQKVGCTDYLSKPIQKDKLMEIIEKYFRI